jgi:prevent-host-death family protein
MDKTTISTSELKANCARVVGEVAARRTRIVITRRGRPVAEIVPVAESATDLFGFASGAIVVRGDIVEPIDVRWEAAR